MDHLGCQQNSISPFGPLTVQTASMFNKLDIIYQPNWILVWRFSSWFQLHRFFLQSNQLTRGFYCSVCTPYSVLEYQQNISPSLHTECQYLPAHFNYQSKTSGRLKSYSLLTVDAFRMLVLSVREMCLPNTAEPICQRSLVSYNCHISQITMCNARLCISFRYSSSSRTFLPQVEVQLFEGKF